MSMDNRERAQRPTITVCQYDELPEWVDRNYLPNNGSGKEYATYLLIEDGDYRRVYSDAMEPEDCRLYRDLQWVTVELERLAQLLDQRDAEVRRNEACGTCPFCGETDFDLIGLKAHLLRWCEKFNEVSQPWAQQVPERLAALRQKAGEKP